MAGQVSSGQPGLVQWTLDTGRFGSSGQADVQAENKQGK